MREARSYITKTGIAPVFFIQNGDCKLIFAKRPKGCIIISCYEDPLSYGLQSV